MVEHQYLDVLEAKLPGAKALARALEGDSKNEDTKIDVLQAVVGELEANRSIPEARYR